MKRVAVCGAGGFIGHHLVKHLKANGYWVRGVDIKLPEYEDSAADEFQILDLRFLESCLEACRGVEHVYQLAADMGGIGYITQHHYEIFRGNAFINLNMLEAAKIMGVARYLFTSSACVYPKYKQESPDITGLKEEDAYPADAEKGYGWEKLFSEMASEYVRSGTFMTTRIVRLHNVYGPLGSYDGGREKAPAAVCRKVAMAKDGGEIEIWGDGKQTRSFLYVDDCVEGLRLIMHSGQQDPINLGTEEKVTIDQLVDLVCEIAGKKLVKVYQADKPQGVRGRNSDNTKLRKVLLTWEPSITLRQGLEATYAWIEEQVRSL